MVAFWSNREKQAVASHRAERKMVQGGEKNLPGHIGFWAATGRF